MLKVFYLKLSDWSEYPDEYFMAYVSEDTKQLAENCRKEITRRTKLLGEFMSRRLIESVWGLKSGDYQIIRGEHGKPFISGTTLPCFFNLSHSGEYIVCALTEGQVGVDIERKGRLRLEVARRFFHPEEVRVLESLPERQQADAFFSYWSVKESFLKYTGSGLSASLSGFEVCFQKDSIRLRKDNRYEPVSVHMCDIDSGYKCFVCARSPELPEISPFKISG